LVQKGLDHSDLSTAMVYMHIHDEEVETPMKQLQPATLCTTAVSLGSGAQFARSLTEPRLPLGRSRAVREVDPH